MQGYGNIIWLCVWFVMVIQFCATSSLTTLANNHSISPLVNLRFTRVRLDVKDLNAVSYIEFIDALRRALLNPNEDVRDWHGYGVLRSTDNLREEDRFVLVELSVPDVADASFTFVINVTNVYVVGFLAGGHAHYFPGYLNDIQIAFPNVAPDHRHQLPFGEGYDSLQRAANANRDLIDLGADPLQSAVSSLYYDSRNGPINSQTQQRAARNLIVSIQMIAEATRNHIIAGRISTWISNSISTPPEPDMIEYETSWGTISERIQESGKNGVFDVTQLVDRYNQQIFVSNVNDFYVRFAIALMIYICPPQQKLIDRFSLLIIRPLVIEDDVCVNPEDPIVRIAGPSGLCAGVKDGDYRNRKAIVLQPCTSNPGVSQLWTFKRNGMIQSKGKCLTCYGNQLGDYIMINDCPSQVTDVTRWQVWDNGTILSGTGLVLSANAGDEGTILRLEANIYTTAQSWRPTSYTKPFLTSITGLKSLCLQATESKVSLEKCVIGKAEQRWLLYPDGSVRTHRDEGACLSGDIKHDNIVRIVSCYPLAVGQRWQFKSDGTILNLNYDRVLDVLNSDPSLKQIVIWPSTGNANQKWSPVF